MKLILADDVKKLGKTGDTVDVADGYARNYLIPRGLAFKATPGNMKVVEKKKEMQRAQMEKAKQEAEALAKKIAAISCTITMAAGEDDKLFGAVTTQDITDVLKQEGIIMII